MSMDAKQTEARSLMQWLRDMPRWKKIAVAAGLGTVVVSAVLHVTTGGATTGGGAPGGLHTSLVEGGGKSGSTAAIEPASQGVFRLGFSFLAGFCIGSFLRATLRIAAIAFGFWLVMTFVLSYMGIVVVDWNAMDALWNRFAENVGKEWADFQTFITGSLPAAGLAVTGLMVGLKKH